MSVAGATPKSKKRARITMPTHIQVVEDSPIQAEMLRRILVDAQYEVTLATNGVEGLEALRRGHPDLVISDVTMPVMDGFEMCRRIRDDASLDDIPVILLTAMSDFEDVVRGLNAGADNYVTKPYDHAVLLERVRATLARPVRDRGEPRLELTAELADGPVAVRAGGQQMLNLMLPTYRNALLQNRQLLSTQDELATLNARLQQEVERQSAALLENERRLSHERELMLKRESSHLRAMQKSLVESVTAVAATVEMRDPYTAGHQRRVADLAVVIGRQLSLSEDELQALHIAGVVHDAGKVRIPAEILTKPGRLDAVEFEFVKLHVQTGYDILKNISFPWPIANIVLQHHERLDGTGYPLGVGGDDVMFASRILSVADVVESMSTARPYRKSLGLDVAVAEILNNRDTKYDRRVAEALVHVVHNQLWQPEVL